MKVIVKKYGGTSVSSVTKIKNIAKKVVEDATRNSIVVVLSAMGKTTDQLVSLANRCTKNPDMRDYDLLVSSGEQVSISLLSMSIKDLGRDSVAYTGWQAGIRTNNSHSSARIVDINANKIKKDLKENKIVIVAGFQGININNRITTLERGGTDASAIMCAKFFNAYKCIIYTDVDGVFTTDPNLLNSAKKIKEISYDEMLEMASLGSKVMQPAAIQDARLNKIEVDVRSSFNKKKGTTIKRRNKIFNSNVIRGISFTKNDAKITLIGVKDKPGVAANIFKPLYQNSINVDMVVQNISASGKETDLTFTIKLDDLLKTKKLINSNKKIKYKKILINKNVSKVSIVGVGMITTPGVTYRMFKALAEKNINIEVISTSEIKISVLIDKKYLKKSVEILHKEFNLNSTQ